MVTRGTSRSLFAKLAPDAEWARAAQRSSASYGIELIRRRRSVSTSFFGRPPEPLVQVRQPLFADAEFAEDAVEEVVGRGGAGDLGQRRQGEAEFGGDEIFASVRSVDRCSGRR